MPDAPTVPPQAVDDYLEPDDAFAPDEGSGDTDGNVFDNDINEDDVPFELIEVGADGAPGEWVDGDDGGRFRILADGKVDFDAEDDFEDLAPGETRTTEVTYTIGFEGPASTFDVMLLQDLSGSFYDDLENLRVLLPEVMETLNADYDAEFGVASFVDKPYNNFGSRPDYVYRTDLAVTDDMAAVEASLDELTVLGGGDGPEAQLEALLQLALRADSDEVSYREDVQRIVVLTTDASFHREGDFDTTLNGKPVPDNDGDAVAEKEDYPSIGMVAEALQAADITPVFAVTSSVMAEYEALVEEMGFGTVVELTSDSSNLVEAILDGIDQAGGRSTATVSAQVSGDLSNAPVIEEVTVDGELREGSPITLEAFAYDPWYYGEGGGESSLTYAFDFDGDGETDVLNTIGRATFVYDDDGPQTVSVRVSNDNGDTRRQDVDLDIANAPVMLALDPVEGPISTGDKVVLTGTITDPGVADTFELIINWGEKGPGGKQTLLFDASPTGTQTFSVSHRYSEASSGPSPDSYEIKGTLFDDDGSRDIDLVSVEIENAAPTVTLDRVAAIAENGVAVLTGTVGDTDPGETLTLKVDWGDETTLETVKFEDAGSQTSFRLTHRYRDDQPGGLDDKYEITATVRDGQGATDEATRMANVRNVAPSLDGGTRADIPDGGPVSYSRQLGYSGAFADVGPVDEHDVTIHWGDGSSTNSLDNPAAFTMTDTADGARFTTAHNYDDGGVYRIKTVVKDDDGGSDVTRQKIFVTGMRLSDDGEIQFVAARGGINAYLFSDRGPASDERSDLGVAPADNNIVVLDTDLRGGMQQTFDLEEVERVFFRGSDQRDVFVMFEGFADESFIDGRGGEDDLRGGSSRDHIKGGNGADLLFGQLGRDTVDGGLGNDQIFGDFDGPAGGGAADVLMGKRGNDTVVGGRGEDDLSGNMGRDWLAGGHGGDTVMGGKGADVMFGDTDMLEGRGGPLATRGDGPSALRALPGEDRPQAVTLLRDGADLMDGGEGNDLMFGQGGDDDMRGGLGNDTMDGGIGNDLLRLGGGRDVVVFDGGDGRDTVWGFAPGTGDVIDLRELGRAAIADAGDVLARARQVEGDVVLDLGGTDRIVLVNTLLTNLTEDAFWV